MEWVETTASTVELAKDMLLDRLGVDEQEAEFEVLEEPKAGLFGRVRGQYRVRARIAPKAQRSKDEKRRRPAKSKDRERKPAARTDAPATERSTTGPSTAAPRAESAPRPPREQREPREPRNEVADDRVPATREEAEAMAADVTEFLDGLVREFGLTATTTVVLDDEGQLQASVEGSQLGALIGPKGGMLSALEEMCRTRVQHLANGGSSPRLRLDVGGYREMRRDHLAELVADVVERVRESGRPHVLDVLSSSERKLVHDTAGAFDGIATQSEGEEPNRRVAVVLQ